MSNKIGPAEVLRNHNSSNQQDSVILEIHESIHGCYGVDIWNVFSLPKAILPSGSNGIFCVFLAILLKGIRGKHLQALGT